MRRVPANPRLSHKKSSVELAQIYHRNAIAITLVARILPQLQRYRHENCSVLTCFQSDQERIEPNELSRDSDKQAKGRILS